MKGIHSESYTGKTMLCVQTNFIFVADRWKGFISQTLLKLDRSRMAEFWPMEMWKWYMPLSGLVIKSSALSSMLPLPILWWHWKIHVEDDGPMRGKKSQSLKDSLEPRLMEMWEISLCCVNPLTLGSFVIAANILKLTHSYAKCFLIYYLIKFWAEPPLNLAGQLLFFLFCRF